MTRKEKQNEKENSYYRPAFGVCADCLHECQLRFCEPQYYNYGTVSVEAANFRARPELDEKNVLGTLLKGDRVRILQGVNGDGISWYYVRVATGANANKTGYVSTGCVTLDAVSTGYATLD
mgnify:CR=1 FL=1